MNNYKNAMVLTHARISSKIRLTVLGTAIMRHNILAASMVAIFSCATAGGAHAAAYVLSVISNPDVADARGINNLGQISGLAEDHAGGHGYVDTAGNLALFDFPRATVFHIGGLNDSAQVVGNYSNTALYSGPFIFSGFLETAGSLSSINVPGAISTYAQGINNAGEIVGYYADTSNVIHGFIDKAGIFTPINFTSMGVPNVSFTQVLGISNSGQIAGVFNDGTTTHSYVYANGAFTTIDVPGAIYTQAMGINDAGQVVGSYNDSTGVHGFVDTAGSFVTIDASAYNFTDVTGINDAGQITGFSFNQYDVPFAFVGTPVPEPASTALLAFGLAALGLVRVAMPRCLR